MLKKLAGWMQRVYQGYTDDKTFSKELARVRLKGTVASRFHMAGVANRARLKQDSFIVNILSEVLKEEIYCIKESQDKGEYVPNAPIWVCWWSGLETAPELVKRCIESIKISAGRHPVHLIDENSFKQYLNIPSYLLEKVKEKKMCLANFSDYLRFSLLNQYGGMWIDATVFCTQKISESYFQRALFTCNVNSGTSFISNGKWTSFIFGGYKGHALFNYMQRAFETYWKKYDSAIDYLLVDYLVYLGYTNSKTIRQDIDSIPINNLHRNELRAAMNRREPADKLGEYVFQDTCFQKLSWREHYSLTDDKGDESIYAAFLRKGNSENDDFCRDDNI